MGGILKTTLARASYEAPQTLSHFDVRFWVTVSQDYNIQDILRGLLPKAEQTTRADEQLTEYVHKNFKDRRYLIVLDDMWDNNVWDRVRIAFPDDNMGSRVILTTRSLRVASYVGSTSPVHEMQLLNKDQSWDLLRENVYGHDRCSPEFENMGKMIAKNCKGLPLAVVVIAGLLKFNMTRDYWEQVARNTDEKVTTSNDHLFEILLWSYTRLPPQLKACFLYMGFYKEDYEIQRKELVMLWASEGFLKPKQCRSMEEVEEECLEELAQRSLVLVTKRSYNGKISSFSVHDVIREVSIRMAEEEKFHHHFTSAVDESTFRNVLSVQRRVSVNNCYTDNFPHDTVYVAIHTLIDQEEYSFRSMGIIKSFRLLRVLSKARLSKESELGILCTLTNLRYLHFDCEFMDSPILIPKSISDLQNLETLIVSEACRTVVFPLEIWTLRHLRHIIGNTDLPVPTPNQGCPVISNIQTLDIKFAKNFVEIFPNLMKLILYFKRDFEQEYPVENLQHLHQLEKLSITCDSFYWVTPTNFVFPENLKKLTLYQTKIPAENLSCIGSLPNLKVLILKQGSLEDDVWEPKEGEFLQLEKLKTHGLTIKHWRAESKHFPCLRKLIITYCNMLEEIPESIGEIDMLETLIVGVRREDAKRSAYLNNPIPRDPILCFRFHIFW